MNSEKVKEIKKALEQNDDNGIMHEVNDQNGTCKFIHHKDILTLINELESESDTQHTNLCEYRKENQQLKDRIAELEKEKKEHGKKKFLRGWKLGIEEFSARLKECAGQSYVSQNGKRISDITYSISDSTTNKILKELLCGK